MGFSISYRKVMFVGFLRVRYVSSVLFINPLKPQLYSSFCLLQAVAGIIAAVANIITIAFASHPQNVGFVYFLIAVGIIAFTIVLFFLLFKNVGLVSLLWRISK